MLHAHSPADTSRRRDSCPKCCRRPWCAGHGAAGDGGPAGFPLKGLMGACSQQSAPLQVGNRRPCLLCRWQLQCVCSAAKALSALQIRLPGCTLSTATEHKPLLCCWCKQMSPRPGASPRFLGNTWTSAASLSSVPLSVTKLCLAPATPLCRLLVSALIMAGKRSLTSRFTSCSTVAE